MQVDEFLQIRIAYDLYVTVTQQEHMFPDFCMPHYQGSVPLVGLIFNNAAIFNFNYNFNFTFKNFNQLMSSTSTGQDLNCFLQHLSSNAIYFY